MEVKNYNTSTGSGWANLMGAIDILPMGEEEDHYAVYFRGEVYGTLQRDREDWSCWTAMTLDNRLMDAEVHRIDAASLLVTDRHGVDFYL